MVSSYIIRRVPGPLALNDKANWGQNPALPKWNDVPPSMEETDQRPVSSEPQAAMALVALFRQIQMTYHIKVIIIQH